MIVYRCSRRFFCTPLGVYIPVGAMVARYENAVRLVVNSDPNGTVDQLLNEGLVYEDPKSVTWFYGVEPPPRGSSTSSPFSFV